MKYTILGLTVATALLTAGCGQPPDAAAPSAAPLPPTIGARHDPTRTGTVTGRVAWVGEVPKPPPLTAAVPNGTGYVWGEMPNSFAPVVDETTRGLAGAVVFLRRVDPATARPWDLPPVRAELKDFRIHIYQGPDGPRRVGFVRIGDEVEAASADPVHHSLRFRGAAYFTLPFPDPGRPLRRRLDQPGQVELTSGAGYYWAAADLFVCDHPYYTVTGPDGGFTLPGVPAGEYELVCWVRNWTPVGKDRDPETGLICRQQYAAALEKIQPIVVAVGKRSDVPLSVSAAEFPAAGR